MHADVNVYECDRVRTGRHIARLEQTCESFRVLADEALAMLARSQAKEERLIGMVEERDRLIAELRNRIALVSEPFGPSWEGTE